MAASKGRQPHSGESIISLHITYTSCALFIFGYKLYPLQKELKDHWSIWINGNWRVTLRFAGCDEELLRYHDYH